MMYNAFMADDDMLDTEFLFQPRGQGTGWCFRMATPVALIGRTNPKTGKSYGREIRQGLSTRDLGEARKKRDILLGHIRQDELGDDEQYDFSIRGALKVRRDLESIEDPHQRQEAELVWVENAADELHRKSPKAAKRWAKIAKGEGCPIKTAYEEYIAGDAAKKSKSYLNNLKTAVTELLAFAGEDASFPDIDRREVYKFVVEYLPKKTSPKAPEGQGPATIRKKVSQLSAFWKWGYRRGFIKPFSRETPWDEQAPKSEEVAKAKAPRRVFTPEETRKLFARAPLGKALGDVIRIALLTGVRLEEVASLEADAVEPEAGAYRVREGKTVNAVRYVPLVGVAQEIVRRRLEAVGRQGPLFPEVPVRASTGKRGGSLSQEFTRFRRAVLGDESDDELALHAFRHTWRTVARQARVAEADIKEMGGWAREKSTDQPYDHGLREEQYREAQKAIYDELVRQKYLEVND